MDRVRPGWQKRHETPDPMRSDAVKAWIQGVLAREAGSGGSNAVKARFQGVLRSEAGFRVRGSNAVKLWVQGVLAP